MKYIRTKDGIWEYVGKGELSLRPKSKLVDYYVNKRLHCFVSYGYGRLKEERIIAQADTIEELCDEFVYFNENEEPLVTKILTFGSIMRMDGDYMIKYGAIWTDKGLIYVAKMNESGILELI